MRYVRCAASDVPSNVRFDIPRRLQGSEPEVAFGDPGSRYEADHGALFKRVTEHSIGPLAIAFYRRVD